MFCAGDETGAAGVSFSTHGLHDAQAMRHADADQLSLALIAARNQTLRWLSLFESAGDVAAPTPHAHFEPARWLAGHAGWWQERWIARNVQRSRGAQGDATRAPLASIEPDADRWWDPLACPPDQRWSLLLPDFEATRAYMVDTLETTLELLAAAAADDTACITFALRYRPKTHSSNASPRWPRRSNCKPRWRWCRRACSASHASRCVGVRSAGRSARR